MGEKGKIDCHVHAWNIEKVDYPWLKGNTSILNRSWSLDELENEREDNQVSGGIMVQAANNLEDTAAMLEECEKRDWLMGAIGWLPLLIPSKTEEEILRLKQNPWFKGVRHLIHDEPDPNWLLQKEVVQSFGHLEKKQIPFDVVATKSSHLDAVLKLSEKYPDQFWCLDHLAHPPCKTRERWGTWGEGMKSVSKNPKVWIKISGLGMCTSDLDRWAPDELQPYVEFCLELFGPERAVMGGDWPVVELCGGYSKSWHAYEEILSRSLSSKEIEKIQFDNAVQFYKLPTSRY